MIKQVFKKIKNFEIKTKSVSFRFSGYKTFDISYQLCGYFDNRPRIIFSPYIFHFELILPFRNNWTDECDPPKWGVAIHNNTLWIYKGGEGNLGEGKNWWAWNFPFLTKEWVRTSLLLKDGSWEHETRKERKTFYHDHWKKRRKEWKYDYKDFYDGEIIPSVIHVQEREWRPKWLTWTTLFATKRRTIEVNFSRECGERKGSWKGGVIGCGYNLLPNEDPLECVKRMERERKF